ncbi:Mannan-binding lectin serine protease 1 [Armadillidium vulgare]|nr:Mannan-binding lectin serine protease 1 [Armadillidium vulgare]
MHYARDGPSKSSRLIGRYCSRQEAFVSFNTTNNQLRIKFKVCNTELRGLGGVIESPNFPNLYPHYRNCTWVIKAPLGNSINASFSHFDVEDPQSLTSTICEYDYVEIRVGRQKAEIPARTVIGHFCGSRIPNPVYTEAGFDIMEVQFKSDESFSRNGFRLEWIVHVCNTELRGLGGVIESPNFPNLYPHYRNCTWVIKAPLGNSINASFSHFDVEDPQSLTSTICEYDYVEIRVGRQKAEIPARTVIGHFCGSRIPNPVYTEAGFDIMEVQFKSDESFSRNGFRLEWIVHEYHSSVNLKYPSLV